MKIGIVADVHGDIEALDLALDVLDKRNVDLIVCAGDVVGKGPDPLPVIERLRDRQIACIAGNHEISRIAGNAKLDQTLRYIQVYPRSLRFDWEGYKVLLAHGAPWSDMVFVFPHTERHIFKRIAAEANADVVILGHTHVPLVAQIGKLFICNPGSVCGSFTNGSRTCGVLSLPDSAFEVLDISTGQVVDVSRVRLIG